TLAAEVGPMTKPGLLILVVTCSAAAAAITIALRSSRCGGAECGEQCTVPPPQPEVRRDSQPEPVVLLESPDKESATSASTPPAPEEPRRPVATSPVATLLAMPETTRAEMGAKRDALRAEVAKQTPPPFWKQRFDAGQSEFISEEHKYSTRPGD